MLEPVGPVLRAGDGEIIHIFSLGVRFMMDGRMTGGRFSVVEHPLPPRSLGAPLHTHRHEDEYSYVVEGRIGVQLGDEVLEVGPGDLVFKERGVRHAFWNPGEEPARVLEIISPAGFENYFRDVVALHAAGTANLDAIADVQARYGLAMDFASAPVLAKRHGLRPR